MKENRLVHSVGMGKCIWVGDKEISDLICPTDGTSLIVEPLGENHYYCPICDAAYPKVSKQEELNDYATEHRKYLLKKKKIFLDKLQI